MNRHAQEDERRYAKDDWMHFFYSMCSACRVTWFVSNRRHNEVSKIHNNQFIISIIRGFFILKIMGEQFKSNALKRVFIEFANNLMVDDKNRKNVTILYYDRLYQIISEEIERVNLSKPAFVSWIKNEDKSEARQELAKIPKISSINDPFGIIEPQHSEVNFNHFYKQSEYISVDEIFEKRPLDFNVGASNLKSGTNSIKIIKHCRKSSALKSRK